MKSLGSFSAAQGLFRPRCGAHSSPQDFGFDRSERSDDGLVLGLQHAASSKCFKDFNSPAKGSKL